MDREPHPQSYEIAETNERRAFGALQASRLAAILLGLMGGDIDNVVREAGAMRSTNTPSEKSSPKRVATSGQSEYVGSDPLANPDEYAKLSSALSVYGVYLPKYEQHTRLDFKTVVAMTLIRGIESLPGDAHKEAVAAIKADDVLNEFYKGYLKLAGRENTDLA